MNVEVTLDMKVDELEEAEDVGSRADARAAFLRRPQTRHRGRSSRVRLRRSSEGIADWCLVTEQAQRGMSWSTSTGLTFPALPGASSLVLVFTEPIVQGYRHGLGLRANCQLREHPDLVVLNRLDSYP